MCGVYEPDGPVLLPSTRSCRWPPGQTRSRILSYTLMFVVAMACGLWCSTPFADFSPATHPWTWNTQWSQWEFPNMVLTFSHKLDLRGSSTLTVALGESMANAATNITPSNVRLLCHRILSRRCRNLAQFRVQNWSLQCRAMTPRHVVSGYAASILLSRWQRSASTPSVYFRR